MRRARMLSILVASVLAGPALARAQEPAAADPADSGPTTAGGTSSPNTSPAVSTSTPSSAPAASAGSLSSASPTSATTDVTSGPAPAASPAPANDVAPAPATTPGNTPPAAQPGPVAPASVPRPEISPPPRLQLSAGMVFGPHALGEADCQSNDGISECQHRGNFLGAGATIELRAQLFKFLYLHARGVVVGNVRQRPYAVHSGLAGGGLGLGVYSRLAFIRGEYMLIPAFGPETYVPPFYDKQVARDHYGLHAGMISGGIHKYVTARTALELWAGFIIGPSAERTSLSMQVNEKRVLKPFMVSVGFVFDLVLAKGYVPPPRQPRKRRVW